MIELLDPSWWTLVAALLPLVVAAVTQQVSESWKKTVVLAALSAAVGIVASLVDNSGALTQAALQNGIETFAVAVISYFGALRSTLAPVVAEKTKKVGI